MPSWFRGTLAKSPFGGVTIRKRQSSVTMDTQYPVKSIGAISRGVCGGCGASPRCAAVPAPRAWVRRLVDEASAIINVVAKNNLYVISVQQGAAHSPPRRGGEARQLNRSWPGVVSSVKRFGRASIEASPDRARASRPPLRGGQCVLPNKWP